MKKYFITWAVLFALCAVLGLIGEPGRVVEGFRQAAAIAFFVPPAILLWKGEAKIRKQIGFFAACSLGLTLTGLIFSILSASGGSRALGNFLHGFLAVVSAPMFCCKWWVVSLFLWACLGLTAWTKGRKEK